jgi:hypothetical protein
VYGKKGVPSWQPILSVLQYSTMTAFDSAARTKIRSTASVQITAKKSLMKIPGNIHGQPAILLLNPAVHPAEQCESWIITGDNT